MNYDAKLEDTQLMSIEDIQSEMFRIRIYCTGCGISKCSIFAPAGLNLTVICDLCGKIMKLDLGA